MKAKRATVDRGLGENMINHIIAYCIRNRLLVLLLTGAAVSWAAWSAINIRLDAIPDLSDVQVIVVTEFPGQNPQVVDDQITYPLSSAMLAVPGAKVVRGYSMFEQSFVYVLFEDGTDIYWARSRVLEYLNFARDRLPRGVEPKLGPDATGVGWVYQYVLYPGYYCPEHPEIRGMEKPGTCALSGKPLVRANLDLAELRSLQDWYLRYPLTSVEGVAEVAPIGGFVKQYQVILDPQKLQAYKLPLVQVMMMVRQSNNDVGGSVIELAENEYMVRSRGYLRGLDDLAKVSVGMGDGGTPIFLGDVAKLQIGGEMRRGVGELNGEGEAVGGVIISRFGENAYQVIQNAKAKLKELENGLPPGVFIKTTYDRSELIERSVSTLRRTLVEEIIVVGLVCILFLLHARSELVAVFVVPASVILAILVMQFFGINANIMSLGGIAIAIGVVVDSAIVMVENAHKHLDREEERVMAGEPATPRSQIILEAATEVGPQLFFSLLIITVSFLPVFVLGGEAGRLFKPLALTKTFTMAAASLLSITIIPVLMHYFITSRVLPVEWGRGKNLAITLAAMFVPGLALVILCGMLPQLNAWKWWIGLSWAVLIAMLLVPQKIIHENHSPISRLLQWMYQPSFAWSMRYPWVVIFAAMIALASTVFPISRLGSEFMPPLEEGDLLYMPTTDPSISVGKSKELLQQTDKLIATFPEVTSVHGKIGRADTATDPAPLSMIETVVQLQPDKSKWRTRKVDGWFGEKTRPITIDELKFGWTDPDGTKHGGLNDVVSFPGVANAWPYPIENRLNMLSTGIKTPVGIKILGPNLDVLSDLAEQSAAAVREVPGTISAYPERAMGGYYLDIDIDRYKAARYGLTSGDVQDVIQIAIGGMNVTTTVEGAERYPLNLRYARELRDDVPAIKNVLITGSNGVQIPLGAIADIKINPGPPMIRSENAQRTAWVFVDISNHDLGGYVTAAKQAVAARVKLPPGYTIVWSGQYEYWEKAIPKLTTASILTIVLIVMLLYISSGSWFRVIIVILAIPFSMIGAFWFLYLMDYNLSLAVVIGMIALAGLDAETGMVMLLYLDNSIERFAKIGRMKNLRDLWHAVHDGAVMRIRPKAMTVAAAFVGLVPLLWAQGTGADTMRRIAAPMIGGLIISFIMELVVYPAVYYLAKARELKLGGGQV